MSGAASGNLGDVHSILNDLKEQVADLQDQIKEQSSTFFARYAEDLTDVDDVMTGLSETLVAAGHGLKHRSGDDIPAVLQVIDTPVKADMGQTLRSISDGVSEAKMAYHNFAIQAKDIVNDADKMDIVVKACQTEFIKLKLMTNNAKARLNAHRLGWARLGYSFRQWAEMVHFATIECIKREMDEVEAQRNAWLEAHGGALAKAQADFDNLLGAQRRIKMELMLRKMRNSKVASAFSTWDELLQARKLAEMEAARAEMMDALAKKHLGMSEAAILQKLQQFMLRWINRKMLPAFKTWRDVMVDAKAARESEANEAELAAMRAKLAQMGSNASMQKLKMFFAMKLGQMKSMCFKALLVYTNQQKALKMLESEAGARIKAFLAGKLQSIGRKCWSAWMHHHDNIAQENMKNNEAAKKVALMLEKLARSLVSRQFHGFIRHYQSALEERKAYAEMMARIGMMDEFNKAKLRVFLDAKRLGKMSGLFKWWADVTRNSALYVLQDEIDKEDAAIATLKEKLQDCEDILGGHAENAHGMRAELMKLEEALKKKLQQVKDLESQLQSMNSKLREANEYVQQEQDERSAALSEIKQLEKDIDKMYATRDGLANQLAGIAGEIGYVHKDSQF